MIEQLIKKDSSQDKKKGDDIRYDEDADDFLYFADHASQYNLSY